jgi:hypothetical protein
MKLKVEITDDRGRTYVGVVNLALSNPPSPSQKKKPLKDSATKDEASLTDRIISLRDNGFFSSPKTSPEVHQEVQKKYYCEPARATTALIRLQKRKELRKATRVVNGKTVVAYVR